MSILISLMSRLIHNAGLTSYLTTYKVHWMATAATSCFTIALVLQIAALFLAKGDLEKLFQCFSILSFCGMGLFKLMSLRNNHQVWRYILTGIRSLENEELNGKFISVAEYESDDENSNHFSDFINKYTDRFKVTSNILVRIYSFTAVVFILSPFVEHAICAFWDGKCESYPHILPGLAPLDNISIFGYAVTILCELVAAIYCVCIHVAFDLTAVGVMIFLCGQWALLRDYSANIGGRGRQLNLLKKRDIRAYFRIKYCHSTHLALTDFITKLDQLLRNIIGVYFFLATLTLCSVAVQLTSVDMSVMQLVSLLQYLGATLTQLFLFSLYGNEVSNESYAGMGQGPFGAACWCISPRIRRLIAMLGAGMMQPRPLQAGPFNNLDLPSFIQVIRAAYSYYAVLGQKN